MPSSRRTQKRRNTISRPRIYSKKGTPRDTSLIEQGTSKEEIDVCSFVKSILPGKRVVKNERSILNGKELDIYIPSAKIAIEFNGLYWHASNMKEDPFYHITKSINCEKQGIHLIHIMSDEWEKRKEVVKDVIRRNLGIYQNISLNSIEVKKITKREGEGFLDSNHIEMSDKSSEVYYGALFENTIMAVISFKRGEHNWVISRFGERMGYGIDNILPIFIDTFRNDFKSENIRVLTAHCDRRLFKGEEFKKSGFKEMTPTNPQPTYTKNFNDRYRFDELKESLRKSKDLKAKGWFEVYDCGQRLFCIRFQ